MSVSRFRISLSFSLSVSWGRRLWEQLQPPTVWSKKCSTTMSWNVTFPFEIALTIASLPQWGTALACLLTQYYSMRMALYVGGVHIHFWGNFIFSISVQLSKNAFIMACAKHGVNLSKPILSANSETACELGLSECYELWDSTGGSKFRDWSASEFSLSQKYVAAWSSISSGVAVGWRTDNT